MRIASVSIDYPGPRDPRRGLFVRRRLAALSRVADVKVVHPEPWFPWVRPLGHSMPQDGGQEGPPVFHRRMFYLPGVLKGLDSYWVERVVVPAVRAIEADGPVDLIDAHFGYPEGVGCVRAARSLGRPVFITMRGLERQILAHRRRGAQLRWALSRCTGIVCVSKSLECLAVAEGVDPRKIRVIPNAVDRGTFRAGDRAAARHALGIDQDARLIVAVGMLVHGKGHHLLVRAAARLFPGHRDLRLVIIGRQAHEPGYPRMLRELVDELGLSDVVLLAGSQPPDRVATWLRAADLFSLPTYDEGCCNSVLEAMACGLPVVTTPAGDNAALVAPPHRGLIVPCDNEEALAGGIEAALRMPWDRGKIARHGADYTWDEVARRSTCFFRERLHAEDPVGRPRRGRSSCAG